MRATLGIVALLVVSGATTHAQTPRWHVDGGVTGLVEAWDENDTRESLAGVTIGMDWRAWKGLAVRAEGLIVRVKQAGRDGWLRGFTVGTRTRWRRHRASPFVELAVGLSDSTTPVPPRGTAFNFLIIAGGGLEIPLGRFALALGPRWLHVSNNGRQGNHRNPDIQSLGLMVGIGKAY